MKNRLSIAILLLAGSGVFFFSSYWPASTQAFSLDGQSIDPFARAAAATTLIFVGTDCPISNRYAPEIQRLAARYNAEGVAFWLVYVDPDLERAEIRRHLSDFGHTITALHDPEHALVKKAKAEVTPEAAVFDADGDLVYRGRIDDRYIDFGKARPNARSRDLEQALQAVLAGRRPATERTRAVGCYIADLKE
jgi:hypothetical protein